MTEMKFSNFRATVAGFVAALSVAFIFSAVAAPPSPPNYVQNPTANPLTVSFTDTLTSDTEVTSTALTARIVLSSNNRPYAGQKFVIQNSGASTDAAIEYYLGGKVVTTATSGWTPQATAIYNVTLAINNAFKAGDVIYFYDESTQAVQAYGQVITCVNKAVQLYALGGDAGLPASGSIVGFKNAYTFTTGYGIKVYPTESSAPITPIYSGYVESILIRLPASGTAHYRVIQTQ